jgi:hypothetical protein
VDVQAAWFLRLQLCRDFVQRGKEAKLVQEGGRRSYTTRRISATAACVRPISSVSSTSASGSCTRRRRAV